MRRDKAVALLLGAVCIGWLILAFHEARRLRPPSNATTLKAFLSVMPRPNRFEIKVLGDQRCLLVIGPLANQLTLPSGPPAYTFDRSGNLLDWTPDSGDDPKFVERWGYYGRGEPITEAEAIAWTKSR